MEIWLLWAILVLELWSLAASLWDRFASPPPQEEDESLRREARELEKRWNDGVSGILGYDMDRAKVAVRSDEETR